MFIHRKGKGGADARVFLHVIFRYAVYRRARAEIVGPIHTSPHAAPEVVADMHLHGVIGSCSRVLPPKKSLLLVKKVTPVESSSLNFPIALETPRPGLKDQRFVPMFTALLVSYWLNGAVT